MVLFQAQKGFVHFVFADPKDTYLLPSLVQLDLDGYLYYLLKKQGYQSVLFISGLEGTFRLELCDETSREVFLRLGRKSGGFWGKFSQDSDEAGRIWPLSDPDDLPKRFINILKKSKDTALVFRLDTFSEIFGRDPALLREFVRTGQKYLEQSGSILLLRMPITSSGSLKWLTDRKGIFADMDGVCLCPEVRMILEQDQSVKLYEHLAQDMGERCVFLNELTQEQARLAVRSAFLTGEPDWSWDGAELEDMAAFIHGWYHSADLRRRTGPILSENEVCRTKGLLRDLSDGTKRWGLRRAMEELGQPLRQILREQYPPDEEPVRILSDGLLAKKIRQIRVPEGLYSDTPELGKIVIGKFRALAREYQTPRSRPCVPELEKVLMKCLFSLEDAAGKGDTETFERAVRALGYGVERDLRYEEDERKVWRYQLTILQLSQDAFRLEGLIREDTDQVVLYTKKKKELIRQIEAQKAAMGTGIVRGITAQEHELSVKMHEAVDLDKLIDNITRSRAVKQERRNQSLTTLHDLELAVGSLGLGIGRDVEAVFRDALDAMERDAVTHQRTEAKFQELGKSMDLVMQEMPVRSEDVDLLEEYEKMLGSLEEEPLMLLE